MTRPRSSTYKAVIRCLVAFIITLVSLGGLLVAVSAIPTKYIDENLKKSFDYINQEEYYRMISGVSVWALDNNTDEIMLSEAYTRDSDSPIVSTMNSLYKYCDHTDHILCLNSVGGTNSPVTTKTYDYGRYWHGYLLTLRPLLVFLDYHKIRILTAIAFFLSLLWSCIGVFRRCPAVYGWLYLLIVCAFSLPAVPLSLQYFTCHFITFTAIGLLTSFPSLTKGTALPVFFFCIGMVTVFFDFLTTPTMTLCFPMIICMGMRVRQWKPADVVALSFYWGAGYALLWAAKWVLASTLTETNYFADAFESMALRTGGGIVMTYSKLILVGLFIILFDELISRLLKPHKSSGGRHLYLLLIAAIPPLWFLILLNHSFHHFWFTYRAMAASVFAVCLFIYYNRSVCHAPQSSSHATTKR